MSAMADPMVRAVGRIEPEENECALVVGVDYDTVTIWAGSARRLTSAQAEEFARLFVAACWEAAGQRAAMAEGDRG